MSESWRPPSGCATWRTHSSRRTGSRVARTASRASSWYMCVAPAPFGPGPRTIDPRAMGAPRGAKCLSCGLWRWCSLCASRRGRRTWARKRCTWTPMPALATRGTRPRSRS
eukprot:4533722-Prymnesium_polylepis.1